MRHSEAVRMDNSGTALLLGYSYILFLSFGYSKVDLGTWGLRNSKTLVFGSHLVLHTISGHVGPACG